MSFFELFGTKRKPTIQVPSLGNLTWSEENHEYSGLFNNLNFTVADSGGNALHAELVAYIENTLTKPELLLAALEQQKSLWIARYPNCAAEVGPLNIDNIGFYWRNGQGKMLITLTPESERNLWRLEFVGHTCVGLGFDS